MVYEKKKKNEKGLCVYIIMTFLLHNCPNLESCPVCKERQKSHSPSGRDSKIFHKTLFVQYTKSFTITKPNQELHVSARVTSILLQRGASDAQVKHLPVHGGTVSACSKQTDLL